MSVVRRSSVGRYRAVVLGVAALAMLLSGCKKEQAASAPAGPPLVAMIRAADWMGSEWSEDAIKFGLSEMGLEAGQDYELRVTSAQGDIATLPGLLDQARDAHAKVIVTLQDATLQVAVERVKDVPVVFHLLSDPFAVGAGTSDSSHLPNITGVYSPGFGDPEQERRVDLIRRTLPKAKRVGILFSPDEALSVTLKDKMTNAAQKAGLTVVAQPIASVAEAGAAAQALVAKGVDAIEIYGNAAHTAFEAIITVTREKKVPVFSSSPFEVMKGAVAAFYPDFQEGGVEAGKMIGRILKGESPAGIPFFRVETTKLLVNPNAGVSVPAEVTSQGEVVGGTPQ
jgi:ABC-type uncharacterized transport system substrate-binding protein